MKCHAVTHLQGEREPVDCKQPVENGSRYCYYHRKLAKHMLTPSSVAVKVEDKDGRVLWTR